MADAPLKPAQKKSIMKSNLSKRERAMRRMYGELADEELLVNGGSGAGGADAPVAMSSARFAPTDGASAVFVRCSNAMTAA